MLPVRMLGLLVLMFFRCAGADSTCPPELNPLTLVPAEVIEEYEQSVSVNCTSSLWSYDEMFLRFGDTDHSADGDQSIEKSLLLSDWDITAGCRIKVDATLECSQDLKITIYKNPAEVIMLPVNNVTSVVEGTPYELQCDVFDVAPAQNLTVRWYKNNQTIHTESFNHIINKTPVNISSVHEVNLNRTEDGAQFKCEAQLDFGPYASQPPVTSDTHEVSVHYAPEFKSTMIFETVAVYEGDTATLNCEAEGNPPPVFEWTRDGVNILENTSSLNITVNTSAPYTCKATNYLGSKNKLIYVRVLHRPIVLTTPSAPRDCPLTLTPDEVVVRFGDEVSVFCNTSETDVHGMGWEVSTGGTAFTKGVTALAWTVEKLKVWDVEPLCHITLSDGYQCRQTPHITLYKTPDTVTLSATHSEVVEGGEYLLNCDITNVTPVQNLTVKWYRGHDMVYSHGFSGTSKSPVNVSSTLRFTAERHHNGAPFRCEAELQLGPKGPEPVPTETSSPYTAVVHYAPEFKSKKTLETAAVYEGDTATLNCEAEGNPPPVFEWTRDGVNILESTSSLNITVNTSATYTCRATNYLGSKNKPIYVRVLQRLIELTTPSAPRDCPLTLTPDEVVVRFGDEVSVFCNTSETDVHGMGWEVSTGGTAFTKGVTALAWTVEKLKVWDVEPLCHITLNDGYQCRQTPHITLYKTPDTVTLSATHSEVVEGGEYLLNCDITNVTPVQNLTVKWYRGHDMVYSHGFSDTSKSPVSVSSTLRFTAERHHNGAPLRCEAELQLGPKGPEPVPTETSSPYTAVVLYKPLFQGCPGRDTGVEHKFSLDMLACNADANPAPAVQWYYQGKPINASRKLDRTHSGKFTIKAENHLGSSNTSIDITVEYIPSFTCNESYKVQEGAEPQTLCEPKGMPKPIVTWFKDGISKRTPQRWERNDSGEYILRASNKHGEAMHKLNLNVLYAPVFMEGNRTEEVALGENVTFGCRAEGNPAPEIRWKFTPAVNAMATTWGRQGNITVTGATSTNAGVYICVATNEIGSVTRSVTLVMKGKTSGVPSWLIWVLLIVFIIVIVIIFAIIHRNCQKKHGQYSFVPTKGQDIPLTTKSDGTKA